MDVNSAFESAKRAAMQGNKHKARSILREIVKAQPRNEAAWLLFAEVAEKPEHTVRCLEQVLKFNPNNEAAREKLAKYRRTGNESISRKSTSASRSPLRTFILIVGGVGIIALGIASILPTFSVIFGNTNKSNSEDAFSYAAGYALSEMYAQSPSRYGCEETENKRAVDWYEIKISDLGNAKYQVIGAMKAIDEFCLYNTGYFAATVFYNSNTKDWGLSDKVYFSNPCMTLSYAVTENDFGICTTWKYGWTPDMNWRPPK